MKRTFCSALVMLISIWVLSGCGGGYQSTSMSAVSVSLSPSTAQSVDQGQTINITAAVANDSAYRGVTWSVSGGGTLSGSTTTTVTYNAPSHEQNCFTANHSGARAYDLYYFSSRRYPRYGVQWDP